ACLFVFSSRRRHTRLVSDWSSDVCSSDLNLAAVRLSRPRGQSRRLRRSRSHVGWNGFGRVPENRRRGGRKRARRTRSATHRREQIGRASCRERGGVTEVAGASDTAREAKY